MSDLNLGWVEPSRREIRKAQRLAARRAAALDRVERNIQQKEARTELAQSYKRLKDEQRRLREARAVAKTEERLIRKQMKEERENAAMLGAALARAAAERQAIDDLLAGKASSSDVFVEYESVLSEVNAAKAKLQSAKAETKEVKRRSKLARKRDRLARKAVDILAVAEMDKAIIAADIEDVLPSEEQSFDSSNVNVDQAANPLSSSNISVVTTNDYATAPAVDESITPDGTEVGRSSQNAKYLEKSDSFDITEVVASLDGGSTHSINSVTSYNSLDKEDGTVAQDAEGLGMTTTAEELETHGAITSIELEQSNIDPSPQDQTKHGKTKETFEKSELPLEKFSEDHADPTQGGSAGAEDTSLTGNPTRSWGWSGDVKVSFADTEFVEPGFDDEISKSTQDNIAARDKITKSSFIDPIEPSLTSGDVQSEIDQKMLHSDFERNTEEVAVGNTNPESTPTSTNVSKRDQRKLARIEKRAVRAAARSKRREEQRIAREATRAARDKVRTEKIAAKKASRAKSSEEREKRKSNRIAVLASTLLAKQQSKDVARIEKARIRDEQKDTDREEKRLLKDKRFAKKSKVEEKQKPAASREESRREKRKESKDRLSLSHSHEDEFSNELEIVSESDDGGLTESTNYANSQIDFVTPTDSVSNYDRKSFIDEDLNGTQIDTTDSNSLTQKSKRKALKDARAVVRATRIEAKTVARKNREEEKLSMRALRTAKKAAQRAEREELKQFKREEKAAARQAKTDERIALKLTRAQEREAKNLAKLAARETENIEENSNQPVTINDKSTPDTVEIEFIQTQSVHESLAPELTPKNSTTSGDEKDNATRREIKRLTRERRAEEKRRRKEAKKLLKGMNKNVTEPGKDSGDDFVELVSDQYAQNDEKSTQHSPSTQSDKTKLLRKAERDAGRAAVKAAKREAKIARSEATHADRLARKEAKIERALLKKEERDKRRYEVENSKQLRRAEKLAAREAAKESRTSKRQERASRRDNLNKRTQKSDDQLEPISKSHNKESKNHGTGKTSTANVSETQPTSTSNYEAGLDKRAEQSKSDDAAFAGDIVTNTTDTKGRVAKSIRNDKQSADTSVEISSTDDVDSKAQNMKATARTEFDIDAAGGVTHSDSELLESATDFTGVDIIRDGIAAKTKGRGLRRWVSWIVKKEEAVETEKLSKEASSEARRAAKEEANARKEAEKRAEALQKQETKDATFEAKQLRKIERVREKAERNRKKDDLKRADREERSGAKARADEIRRNAKARHEVEERERREERERLKADKSNESLRSSLTNDFGSPAENIDFDDAGLSNDTTDSGSDVVDPRKSFLGSLRDRSESRRRLRRQLLEARNDNSAREGDDSAVLSKEERRVLRQQLKEERKRIANARKSHEEGEKQERRDRRNAEKSDRRAVEASNKAAGAERERLVRSFKNTRSEEKARKKEAAENTKAEQRRIKEHRKAEVAQKRADEKAAKNSITQDKKYRKEVRRQQKKKVNQQRSLLREETKIARRARRIDIPEIAFTRDEPALGPAYNWDAESGMYNAVGAGNDIDPVAFDLPEPLPRR